MRGMARLVSWWLPAVICAAAPAALGQTAASQAAAPAVPSVSPLVVTAPPEARVLRAMPFSKLEGLTYKFVETHAAAAQPIQQYARWHEPVCPETLGLSDADNAAVSQRIRDVAAEVGAPVEPPGKCVLDVEVMFTDQAQGFMDQVADRKPIFLGYHFVPQTERLKQVKRPVQGWYATQTRGGVLVQIDAAGGGSGVGVTNPMEMGRMPGGCAGSHFTACLKSEFANVLIVVDANRMAGQPLGPLADYVAMLVLTRPASLDACDEIPSILDRLSPACPGRADTQGLTTFDLAYLKALYRTNMSMFGEVQRSNLAGALARTIKSSASDPK